MSSPEGEAANQRFLADYKKIDSLAQRRPSAATTQRLDELRDAMHRAAAHTEGGDWTQAVSLMSVVEREIALLEEALDQSNGRLATEPAYVAADGLYVRLIDAHLHDHLAQHDAHQQLIAAFSDFTETTGVPFSTQVSGRSLTAVVDGDGHPPRTEATLILAMHLQLIASSMAFGVITVVVRGERFTSLDVRGLPGPLLIGQPFAEAAAIGDSLSQPALALTHQAHVALRDGALLRRGRDLPAGPLVEAYHRMLQRNGFAALRADGDQLVYSYEQFDPPGYQFDLEPYLLRLYQRRSELSVIGGPPQLKQRIYAHYRTDVDDVDREFYNGLVEADEVDVVGLTNVNLSSLLVRALRTRQHRGGDGWDALRVYFPTKETLLVVPAPPSAPTESGGVLDRWRSGRKTIMELFESHRNHLARERRVAEYLMSLPLIGARFVIDGKPRFRLALPLPEVAPNERPHLETDLSSRLGRQLERLFTDLRGSARIISERYVWGWALDAGEGAELQLHGVYQDRPPSAEGPGPLVRGGALVVLYSRSRGSDTLLLQRRNEYNSGNGHGRFDNLWTWIYESDLIAASHDPTAAVSSMAESDDDATDLIFERLHLPAKWSLAEGVYRAAIGRECLSDFGIEIEDERLRWHGTQVWPGADGQQVLFGVFSMKLDPQEQQAIKKRRPHADLHHTTLEQLARHADDGQLNAPLERRIDQYFVPLYRELGLA